MKIIWKAPPAALLAAACVFAAVPVTGGSAAAPTSGAGEHVAETFSHVLPNLPGKALVAVEVDYAPGGRSLPHHHAPSAFIYGYVVSGSIRSQIAGGPVRVYKAGESFMEEPGAHHLIGENASRTVPAKLLAVFIVDAHHGPLTTADSASGRP